MVILFALKIHKYRSRQDCVISTNAIPHLAALGLFGKRKRAQISGVVGTNVDKKVVKIVEERAGNYCESCGGRAQESMALHHRKLKSRGGQDTPANLIRVHHSCHNLGTDSIHAKPSWATDKGFMVSSWNEPEQTPMVYPDGRIVLLDNDGNVCTLMEGD